jgi:hypothetical protein
METILGGNSMANKTVEFLKIDLIERISGHKQDYIMLEKILLDIVKSKGISGDECKTIDLTPDITADNVLPKMVLDIFENDLFLFGRICRKKANNAILQRDYDSLVASEVFTPSEAMRKGIEVFTYFIIDLAKGIISIANAKDAPGAGILNNLLDHYNSEYVMRFTNIPNEDGINLLYASTMPEITKLEFVVPSPDPQYLQRILELTEDEIACIAGSDIVTTTLILSPLPYKSLEKDTSKVKRIIDILREKKGIYKQAIIRGKSNEFGNKEFDLQAKYFTYPIQIKKDHVVDGKKKEYNLKEITKQFEAGLVEAYYRNRDLILVIASRRE